MSNSPRAKTRRSKRSHLNKHERGLMGSQHWADKQAHQLAEIKAREPSPLDILLSKLNK